MRRILTVILTLALTLAAAAQQITVSAPAHVQAGENFRVSYTVTTDNAELRSGIHTTDEVELIAGPFTSTESSISMINGKVSSSSSKTFTYTLYAVKAGTYTVPAAHAKAGGKTLVSRTAKVTITGTAKRGNAAPNMHEQDEGGQVKAAGAPISGNELFIRVSANKKRVHEQEPILLTYKVYTTLELTQLEGKMPDLKGFHTQEVKLPQQKSFHIERVNGRAYRCVTWSQYVMYPQMTGQLEIPSITFHGIVVQENRNVDPFEAFFNGGSGYIEVKRDIAAPGVTVQVDALPAKPATFSGGVGQMTVSGQLSTQQVKAGEPVTLRVVVGGTGNLKLLRQPLVAFPKDFDKYDAKVTDKTRLTERGLEGNMIYDFLAVPRNQGEYTIPAVELTYFDTSASAYKTVRTQPFKLSVAKGDGRHATVDKYTDPEDMDIHPLKSDDEPLRTPGAYFFGSTGYMAGLLLPILVFVALLVIFRKRAARLSDIIGMRAGRANKVATRRLRKAHALMLGGRGGEFYDEVLRALWGYVGDKLAMPAEQLSSENIAGNLGTHGVDPASIEKFMTALGECEFERYAPGDASGNMNKTFESAMTAIMEIENVMKRGKRTAAGKTATLIMLMLMMTATAAAATAAKTSSEAADAAYKKGDYQTAIRQYGELLHGGVSSELYYNLGNAYYRTDNLTQAIIAYERALRLSPGDADIRHNLQIARSKTIDKITPESEMFFETWGRGLVFFTSVDRWAVGGLVSMAVALMLVLVYLFMSPLLARKIGFYGAAALIVASILCHLFAWRQRTLLERHQRAVVVVPTLTVKNTPAPTGADGFVIHEGTRMELTDKSITGWWGIRLDDGREGWIRCREAEEI